jgi:hypothetical protein
LFVPFILSTFLFSFFFCLFLPTFFFFNIRFLHPIVVVIKEPGFRHTMYYYYWQCRIKLWATCFNRSGSSSGPYSVLFFRFFLFGFPILIFLVLSPFSFFAI